MSALADAVNAMDVDDLERLLSARPELLTATTKTQLVQEAAKERSIGAAIAQLTLPARQVAEALHLLGHRASFKEVCELDPSADTARLREAVAELRGLLLVTGPDDELVLVRPAERYLPGALGYGRQVVHAHLNTSYYALVEMLRVFEEPRPRSGEAARQQLARVFADAPALAGSLDHMPADLLAFLRGVEAQGPVVRISGLDLALGDVPPVPGLEEALYLGLVASPGPGRVELPFEVGVALRHPRFASYDLEEAVLGASHSDTTAAACAQAVRALLDGVDAIAARMPVPLLPSGGISVKELRALSAATGLDVAGVGMVLRLLQRQGLTTDTRKDVRLTKHWEQWAQQEDASRWLSLVVAWLDDHNLPTPRLDAERKARASNRFDWDSRAIPERLRLVRVLALRRDRAGTASEWLRAWHCRFPERRLHANDARGYVLDRELRLDLLHEAEVLGLIGAGGATPLALALHDGDDVAPVLAALADVGLMRVKAQADLTLICPGRPSRTMRAALDRIADVESSAQATVWRLSEGSLGRAYSEGDAPEDVLAVLEQYAAPVPQPMAYLVGDAHRRYEPVTVGSATSWVVVDDDRLREALMRRGDAAKAVKAVGLTRIAPGVAVSKASQDATIAALKVLGLHASSAPSKRSPRKAAPEVRVPADGSRPVFDISDTARAVAARLLR